MKFEIDTSLTARFLSPGRPSIEAIVLHDTAGSGTHNDTKYLANPGDGRKVSVDFTVERDGAIYQLNPSLRTKHANHAGRATKLIVNGRTFRNNDVTQRTIGIEIVHAANPAKFDPVWPGAQIEAVAFLCAKLCKDHGLTKAQVTTHAAIITDGSRSDPRGFPFPDFWDYFNHYANDGTVSGGGNPAPLSNPVYYTVVDGDTLWSIAKRHNTTVEAIKALNPSLATPSNLITPGEFLKVKK
jgi:N-acetyl-anhydromuramyl-L-alanine amidase AmpD